MTVISVPGHSPGSLCYYFPSQKILLSGDTLFPPSDPASADIMPLQSDEALRAAIADRLLRCRMTRKVYPGTGDYHHERGKRLGTLYRSSN